MSAKRLIPQPIRLGFDPAHAWSPPMRAVVNDDIAWAVWPLWKPSHIVNEDFCQECLTVAKKIRKSAPRSMDDYRACFFYLENFTISDVAAWMPEAYLYLIGTLEIRVEVNKGEQR